MYIKRFQNDLLFKPNEHGIQNSILPSETSSDSQKVEPLTLHNI